MKTLRRFTLLSLLAFALPTGIATAADSPATPTATPAAPVATITTPPMAPGAKPPTSWIFSAQEVGLLKGQPPTWGNRKYLFTGNEIRALGTETSWVPDANRHFYKVVDDPQAQGGKALSMMVDKRAVRFNSGSGSTNEHPGYLPLRVLYTPGLTRQEAPVGLYKVTVRLKYTGMPHVIGTSIWFASTSPGSFDMGGSTPFGKNCIHTFEFNAEDTYQEFSYLTDVSESDLLTHRPIRGVGQGSLANPVQSRQQVELLLDPSKISQADIDTAKALDKTKLLAAITQASTEQLRVYLALEPTPTVGFGKIENNLQSLTIDWIKIERVAEPAITVRQVLPQKIWMRPGDDQLFHVWLQNRSGSTQTGDLHLHLTHGLDEKIDVPGPKVEIKNGEYQVVDVPWTSAKGINLWGVEVTADLMQNGKSISHASDVFSVQQNSWAVMNFGGSNHSRNPYYDPPSYQNYCENFGATPGDSAKVFPEDPSLPYISGMTGYRTQIDLQRVLAERNHAAGIATFMYLSPLASGLYAELLYQKHPEFFGDRIVWSDQADDQWHAKRDEMLARWKAGQPLRLHGEPEGSFYLATNINAASTQIVDDLIDGIKKNMRYVGYDGVRWDGTLGITSTEAFGVKVGPADGNDVQAQADMIRRIKREVRAEFPNYTEGDNDGFGFTNIFYTRKLEPPSLDKSPPFIAFCEDGSSIMDEGWMMAWRFVDQRNVIKDYLWGARQECDACRRAGGFFHSFSPARDGAPYFTQSDIYYNMLIALAGGQYPGQFSCPPASETGMAHFLTRFSQFIWDNKLMELKNPDDLIRVDAPHDLWWEETAVWRDLPDGRRRYVIPLINPPTIDRFFKGDRFGEMAEPIDDPFPVSVKLPDGFTSAKVTMLTAEPQTAQVPLESHIEEGKVAFDVPKLFTFRVIVVEFAK